MAVKDTVSKIMKGVGKSKAGQAVKKAGKHIDGKYFKDIKEGEKLNAMMYQVYPKKLKSRYVYGVMGVGAAISTGSYLLGNNSRNDLGEIVGGGLSQMTSQTTSPLTKSLQRGQYDNANIMHNTSAQGDIVFALHNMR